MADETSFDAGVVRAVNLRVRNSASYTSDAVASITQKCSQHDGCWGNDEFGQSFSKGYKPSEEAMLGNGKLVVEGVTNVSISIDQALEVLQLTDQYNANKL